MNPSAKVPVDNNKSMDSTADKLKSVAGLVLVAHSVLNWEKPYYAPLLGSAITMIYMLFWLIDASVLSKLCLLGITIVILDFSLPILNSVLFKKEWLQDNELKFQQICVRIDDLSARISKAYHVFCQMKHGATKTYYGILLCSLLFVAWLGSLIHNLLLAYIIAMGLALYPGLSKQESFKRQLMALSSKVSSFIAPKSQKTQKPKSKSN